MTLAFILLKGNETEELKVFSKGSLQIYRSLRRRKYPMTHLSRCLFVLSASTYFLTGCGGKNNEAKTKADIPASTKASFLTRGFDSHTQRFKEVSCIEGDVKYAGSQKAGVTVNRNMSLKQIQTELGLETAGKLSLEIVNASAATSFSANVATNKLKDNLTFKFYVNGKDALLDKQILSQRGRDAARTQNIDTIRKSCGDEYVSRVELGGELFVNFGFEFANNEIKTAFKAEIDLDFIDLFQVEGAAKTSLEKFGETVKVRISAHQIGGDPTQLRSILNTDPNGNIPVFQCSLKNPEQCTKAIQNIVKYATDPANGFSRQIQNITYDPTNPKGAAVLKYHTKSYHDAGFVELYPNNPPIIDLAITLQRQKHLRDFSKQSADNKEAHRLLLLPFITNEERARYQAVYDATETNTLALAEVAGHCYSAPLECLDRSKKLQLIAYNADGLYKDMRFLDYCAMPKKPASIEKTLKALYQYLLINPTQTTCKESYTSLSEQDYLDLSEDNVGVKIRDLRPLRSLDNLTYLKVRNADITSISPLKTLKNLAILDMRDNHITNLTALKDLKKITTIDLAYNRLYDINSISSLTSLKNLYLHGNRISDLQPARQLDLNTSFLTEEEVCEFGRTNALERGLIGKKEYSRLKNLELAPLYRDDNQQIIDGFYVCKFAARKIL